MGNAWKGHSEAMLIQYELDAFLSCGVDPTSITQSDINLDGRPNSENYIHIVTCKSTNVDAERLVMIHGFGGGAAVFMRMVPLL
jgi:hypothetical protein